MTQHPDPNTVQRDNRDAWNAATRAHNSHKGDQAAHLRAGHSTLFPEEIALLGDLTGKALLHMMCNSGQDSLSLVKLGAEVTGVDLSDEAIDTAKKLSTDSHIPATFFRSDIYDWLAQPPYGPFDVAFCSYGALCWLPDLNRWADAVAKILTPNSGKLVIMEFHPAINMFKDDWTLGYPWSSRGKALIWEDGIGDYVAKSNEGLVPWGFKEGVKDFTNPHKSHEFIWGLGDILGAILGAGLRIEVFREHFHANGCAFLTDMTMDDQRRFHPPEGIPAVPAMYGLVASK